MTGEKTVETVSPETLRAYFSGRDTVARWWSPEYGPYAYHFRNQFRAIARLGEPAPGDRVLDVGAGTGMFTRWFARQGAQVDAVDLSEEMLAKAFAETEAAGLLDRVRFHRDDASDLSAFAGSEYDWVSCMQTLDHVPDLDAALTAMARCLRPGGRFAFSYVAHESLYGKLYRMLARKVDARLRAAGEPGLVAQPYKHERILSALHDHGFDRPRFAGVGLLCIWVRPDWGVWGSLPRLLNRAEESLFPVYTRRALAMRCTHVIGVAQKSAE